MSPLRSILLFFLLHGRQYQKLLKATQYNVDEITSNVEAKLARYEGVASFYTKNYYHTRKCFELLLKANKATARDCNFLAWLHARHNQKEDAIATWCKALEFDKGNRLARRALDYIRNQGRELNLQEDEYFDTLIPPQPFLLPLKKLVLILVLIIAVSTLSAGGYVAFNKINNWRKNRPAHIRPDLESIVIPDYNPNILDNPADNDKKYSYDEKEVLERFNQAKQYIIDYKPVNAQIEINKIKLSNASAVVKARCDMLADFIDEPDYAIFKNVVTFDQFDEEPDLYEHVFVLWNGRVVNHVLGYNFVAFSLVMGNEEDGVIEGIIPVMFHKPIIVENNQKISVFGNLEREQGGWRIEGRYIIQY